MTEQPAADALRTVRDALRARRAAAADADQGMVEALSDAYTATITGRQRLDRIATDLDAARGLADNPLATREFQRLLIDKTREILAVVAETHQLDEAVRARLAALPYPAER